MAGIGWKGGALGADFWAMDGGSMVVSVVVSDRGLMPRTACASEELAVDMGFNVQQKGTKKKGVKSLNKCM